jgi:hypothetical protein
VGEEFGAEAQGGVEVGAAQGGAGGDGFFRGVREVEGMRAE